MRPGLRPIEVLAKELGRGELTSVELTGDCLQRIRELNETLHVFLYVDEERALEKAAASDSHRRTHGARSALEGIPVGLKDNIVTKDMPTTCASAILDGYRSPYDATVVERLEGAGAIVLGKVNLDEFAMGSSNEHSSRGVTRNPHDPDRVPGGSSGGSCAAVAAGMVPLAFGSDTGGSVRLPASFCGVVGLKPSYGRVSRHGLVAFGSSLDQIGPVARTVAGCELALEVVSGLDEWDTTTAPDRFERTSDVTRDLTGVRLGVIPEFEEGLDEAVARCFQEALATLQERGATVHSVGLPHARFGVSAYYVISSAEASSNLARFDGAHFGHRASEVDSLDSLYVESRSEGFGDEVKRRIMIGTFVLSAGYYGEYYTKASQARDLLRRDFANAFEEVDVLVSPTAPTPAFRLGERLEDPLAMYLTDVLTIPANLAGVPALSIPCGVTPSRLPVGVQLTAPPLQEARLLSIASSIEEVLGVGVPPSLVSGDA